MSSAGSAPAPSRLYLHSLTAMRGIAAWMVVFYHIRAGMPWMPAPLHAVFAKGYLAVDFFFLLSGFVIYLSAHGAILDKGRKAILPFLGRRLARIYPLYAVILALTIAFAAVLTFTRRDISGYPWGELPLHILMMQNWGFTPALSWNHPAWSISTEMAAYLIFPLIVLATPVARMSRTALLAGMAVLLGVMAFWLQAVGLDNLGEYIVNYGIIRCLFEFGAGTMLCAIWLQCGERREPTPVRLAVIIALIGLSICWLVPKGELWGFPATAAALIFLLAEGSRRSERNGSTPPSRLFRTLVYLGEISYATYLVHYMFFTWYKIALVKDAVHIMPWKIGLFLILLLLLSSALYHLVEKPGRRLFTAFGSGAKATANSPLLPSSSSARSSRA